MQYSSRFLLPFFLQFLTNEQESFEHTNWKPITIPFAVCQKSRLILGFKVGTIPPRKNAKKARKKYGPRQNQSKIKTEALMKNLKSFQMKGILDTKVSFISDKKSTYPAIVTQFFPGAQHTTFKGRMAAVAGQGELKVGGKDPLFSLNHTLATVRYRIQTMVRKTWCTTKLMDFQELRMCIFQTYFNMSRLIEMDLVK